MKKKQLRHFFFLLCLLPSQAFAHGEQVFAMPMGQAAVLLVLFVTVFFIRVSRRVRLLFVLAPTCTIVGTYFIPDLWGFIGRNFGYGSTPWLVIGIGPPMAVAISIYIYAWNGRSKPKPILPNRVAGSD